MTGPRPGLTVICPACQDVFHVGISSIDGRTIQARPASPSGMAKWHGKNSQSDAGERLKMHRQLSEKLGTGNALRSVPKVPCLYCMYLGQGAAEQLVEQ